MSCIPRGDGMIAPRAYEAPTALRIAAERLSKRVLRSVTRRTIDASMSSEKESNRCPVPLRKRIAASERRRSRDGLSSPGRYQATTLSPAACAASMKRPIACGRPTSQAVW